MSRIVGPDAADAGRGDVSDLAAVDKVLSYVLRWGVVLSAAIVLLGVALFIAHGGARGVLLASQVAPAGPDTDPRSPGTVLARLVPPDPAAVTDLGLLLLLVTPVVSVAILVVAFALRRDWTYVAIAAFVFAMLMVGFAIGQA